MEATNEVEEGAIVEDAEVEVIRIQNVVDHQCHLPNLRCPHHRLCVFHMLFYLRTIVSLS